MFFCCRPRWEYQSYWDYYELARLSDVPIVYYDEIDWGSDNVYLISPLNGEVPNPLPSHKCKVIWINIERPSVDNGWLFGRPDFDEIWVCDKHWARTTGTRFFLMGSHKDLGYSLKKKYDWISCTYDVPRRTAIWHQIGDLKRAPNGWPGTIKERADALASSRLYVVPQQEGPPHVVTPLRFAIAAAFKLPMIYEGDMDVSPFVPGTHFIHSSYHDFPANVRTSLNNYSKVTEIGKSLHEMLCVNTDFKHSIESMI